MDQYQLAEQLKICRKAKNLTAQQVSSCLKEQGCYVEPRSIYSYESGNRMPNIDVFLNMCKLYECTDILYEFGYREKLTNDSEKEQELLYRYRKLTNREKDILDGFMNIMLNVRNGQDTEDDE